MLTLGVDLEIHVHCSKHLLGSKVSETVLTLGVAIPATDLTINSAILFERVTVMIVIAMTHLCVGGDSPLSYVKNKVLLILFWPQLPYQAK